MEISKTQFVLTDLPHGKPLSLDVLHAGSANGKPVIVFIHGFKGFKDWGTFNMLADFFASHGFVFLKFNFSHNGTTAEKPLDFADLEAFGHNNYSLELDDLGRVLDEVTAGNFGLAEADRERLFLIGHSRGGGMALLKAAEDPRINKLATWAAIGTTNYFYEDPETVKKWKKDGVLYIPNARTGQQMPLYWQLYENWQQHRQRLDIPAAAARLQQPVLLVHGTHDPAVPYAVAETLQQAIPDSRLLAIEGGDHTFGGTHPFSGEKLPADLQRVAEETAAFFS